jgi:pyrroline-5-carboxylate reductase
MKLGVIGCGKMGTALVEGAIRAGAVAPEHVLGCDPVSAAREAFSRKTGAGVVGSIAEVASRCEVLLLCTKPQDALEALRVAAAAVNAEPRMVISIAAGLTVSALEAAVPASFRMVRAMPNTPALIGKGAAAYCLGERATASDAAIADRLLSAVGVSMEVPERLMDAVTGLSGSGPAYVFLFIEALADGGVRNGLPRADALRLAAQTVLGAAAMVLETREHPALLKDAVTSPGGTTIAGLAALETGGVRAAAIEAVTAATRRATELGS